jgi:hypothetical protein
MKKRINCPEGGNEMNLMGRRSMSNCTLDNTVWDRVRRTEDGKTQ